MTSNTSKNQRRLTRFKYDHTKVAEVIGTGKSAYLWIGGENEARRLYWGSIGTRRVIQLLKRAGLIRPEDVSA